MSAKIIIPLLLLLASPVFAQRLPAEIGVISDNDLYVSTVSDKYYTAGFEFYYRYLDKKQSSTAVKKITDFRLGQYIFNPRTRKAEDINRIDRPFAGYLFAEAGRHLYYKDETVVKYTAQIGIVGPDSFAEQSQEAIHFLFGYKRIYGWEHQIRNTAAVQLGLFYARPLLHANNGIADLIVQGKANAGTVLDDARLNLFARISFKNGLLPLYDSNFFGGALNADQEARKSQREFYFYIGPGVHYQLYDATIQGSLFNNDSPKTFGVMPWVFLGEAGLKYRRNNWSASYSFLFHSKEVQDSPNNLNFYYGSIVLSHFLD